MGEFCQIQAENGTYIMPSTYALRSFVSNLVLKKFVVVGKRLGRLDRLYRPVLGQLGTIRTYKKKP